MSKDPAFLFYSSDFLTGVTFFTMEERGQYITILCLLHQNDYYLEIEKAEFVVGKISDNVLNKFEIQDNNKLFNHRLFIESEKRQNYCKSRHKNKEGINQYTKKRSYDHHMTGHMTGHMENENENENINENISKNINKKVFNKPTIKEIKEYCIERYNFVNAEVFFDFYESKGWMIGKNKMKDWKAAVRTWEKNNTEANAVKQGIKKDKCDLLAKVPSAEESDKYLKELTEQY